ncbi:MAG: hypothetical protein QXJ17_02835 [Nitrososphaeria archaeon]
MSNKIPGRHVNPTLDTSSKIRSAIIKTMVKAKRSGIWKRLGRVDRAILTLSTNLQIKFKSINLLRSILKVMKHIAQLTSFERRNYSIGVGLAQKLVKYAVNVGYIGALNWIKDDIYAIWWGIFLNPSTYTR